MTEEQDSTVKKPRPPDERLQQEFNRWAEPGEGPKMERHHLDITEKTIRRMDLRPGERVLDLGCGSGWATRLLARMVGEGPQGFGQVIGVDISDEMIRQARAASKDFENIMFVVRLGGKRFRGKKISSTRCCQWSLSTTTPIRTARWPSCFA